GRESIALSVVVDPLSLACGSPGMTKVNVKE
ncbi:MAG: hypothetical protein K0R61_3310, partial [Microvirga sp.]|nr:hypothetical protein [Microvirga sp.]